VSGSTSLQLAILAAGAGRDGPPARGFRSTTDTRQVLPAESYESSAGPHDNNGSSYRAAAIEQIPAAGHRAETKQFRRVGPFVVDSTKFLLFLHAYRLANEKETREGLSGPFFKGYADAVASIHAGTMAIRSKPTTSTIRWRAASRDIVGSARSALPAGGIWPAPAILEEPLAGDGLRRSLQLAIEIGPLSEASIGNVQDAAPGKNGHRGLGDYADGGISVDGRRRCYGPVRDQEIGSTHDEPLQAVGDSQRAEPYAQRGQHDAGKPPWNRDTRPGITAF